MYIDLYDLFIGILSIIGACALVYLIIALHKLGKVLTSINNILSKNEENINKSCDNLPAISENILTITDNFKDVSDVITETTADVIVAKDNLTDNIELIKDIINIITSVFSKK